MLHDLHVGLLALDVVVGLGAAVATFGGGSRRPAWALLAASALWLPLENRLFEGPVLLVLDARHGLTLSDLLGVAGIAAAALRLWPPRGSTPGRWFRRWSTRVGAVAMTGFLLAAVMTDLRIAELSTSRPDTQTRTATVAPVRPHAGSVAR